MKHMHLWIYLIFKSSSHTTLTKTSQDSPNRNTRNSVVFLACYISSYSRPRRYLLFSNHRKTIIIWYNWNLTILIWLCTCLWPYAMLHTNDIYTIDNHMGFDIYLIYDSITELSTLTSCVPRHLCWEWSVMLTI